MQFKGWNWTCRSQSLLGSTDRGTVLRVRVRTPAGGTARRRFSLIHTVIYGAHKQTHNKEKEIKVLSLSSNRKKLRYGDRSNIFGWFSNGTAETILEMAW